MSIKSLIKQALASTLGTALLFTFLPTSSALDNEKISQGQNNATSFSKRITNDALQKIKKFASEHKKLSITAGVLGAMYAPCLYSKIRHSTPRTLTEKIVGETDETVKTYCSYQVSPPEYFTAEKVDKIICEMNSHNFQNNYDKAKFLHDYIYDHCKYDTLGLIDYFTNFKTNFQSDNIRNVYGCRVNEKAVCAGIADAYCVLLNKAGIECMYVTGEALGCSHSWNIVKINGSWYHVDVTWDLFAKALHGKYSWFMLTEKEITKDHTIDRRL